ncbi:MAG: L,D-transpeptidase family protein [Campylobacterota bacterium]|nr:L,D-transpeptidase family protein [Campylobacterota bacterium]
MKIVFIGLLLVEMLFANTKVNILGYPNQNIEYQENIQRYFKTKLALDIDVHKSILRPYYKKAKNHLIWIKEGELSSLGIQLIQTINDDLMVNESLQKSFNLTHIDMLIKTKEQYQELSVLDTIRLDLLLTYAYSKYISYLSFGDMNWGKFQEQLKELFDKHEVIANWRRTKVNLKKISLLEKSIEQQDILISLNEAHISYKHANKMRETIHAYQKISDEGGYVKIPSIKVLKPNQKNKIVPLLRQRLLQSKDLSQEDFDIAINEEPSVLSDPKTPTQEFALAEDKRDIYDEVLVTAVKSFQTNHGLQVDGVVGRDTIKHFNITVKQKITQIKINLERMRWLPRDLGDKYLLVNIPDYHLRYVEDKKEVLKLPVVVGTRKHPTPVFSHRLTTVVLNPYWRVPERIVQREIVPKLLDDPEYLVARGMNIHENWDHKSPTFNPLAIDWTQYVQTDEQKEQKVYPEVPYKFIQIPSKKNPLGKMKFMFHNRYSVYIHDTSSKHYFKRRQRAFSHGCIRLQTPHKLLKTIANQDKRLKYKEAVDILKDIEKTEVTLSNKIPVHIVYLTAWMDDEGVMQFRDDIYGYDRTQRKLLY